MKAAAAGLELGVVELLAARPPANDALPMPGGVAWVRAFNADSGEIEGELDTADAKTAEQLVREWNAALGDIHVLRDCWLASGGEVALSQDGARVRGRLAGDEVAAERTTTCVDKK